MCVYIYRVVRSRGKSLQEGANPLIARTAKTSSSFLSQTLGEHLTPGLAVPSNARGERLWGTGAAPPHPPGESFCAPRVLALSESSSKGSLLGKTGGGPPASRRTEGKVSKESQVTPDPLWSYYPQVIRHRPETGPTEVRLLELPARNGQACTLGEPGALGPPSSSEPQDTLGCSFQMQETMKAKPRGDVNLSPTNHGVSGPVSEEADGWAEGRAPLHGSDPPLWQEIERAAKGQRGGE